MIKGVIIESSVVEHKFEIRYGLYYKYEEQTDGVVKELIISGKIQTSESESGFEALLGLSNNEISLNIMPMLDPMTTCLASCFVSISVKVILECFNRDVKKYIDCLKSKGPKIAPEVGACIAACLVVI